MEVWAMTVASAAPRIPHLKTKMKTGASATLITTENIVAYIDL